MMSSLQSRNEGGTAFPITPREVVEEMSFAPSKRGDHNVTKKRSNQAEPSNDALKPAAPPPSAPPPPPPPGSGDSPIVTDAHKHSQQDRFTSYVSYQQESGSRSRSAPIPSITNFGLHDGDPSSQSMPLMQGVGDPTLRPNTGQTNDAYGGIGSLTEVATNLRWATLGACTTAVVWEGFAFLPRLVMDVLVHLDQVVLGVYLAVFCILFLGVDLGWNLRDTVGILYHPFGRGIMLVFMSTMCFGMLASWWEKLLGVAFLGCGVMYIYAYWNYPEYRRWHSYEQNTMWEEVKAAVKRRSHGWADPDAAVATARMAWNTATGTNTSSNNNTVATERQTLLSV